MPKIQAKLILAIICLVGAGFLGQQLNKVQLAQLEAQTEYVLDADRLLSSFSTELRSIVAAVLWLKVDRYHHDNMASLKERTDYIPLLYAVVKLDPTFIPAARLLAYLLAVHFDRYQEADLMLRRGIWHLSSGREDGIGDLTDGLWFELSRINLFTGRFIQSWECLEKVLSFPEKLYHRSMDEEDVFLVDTIARILISKIDENSNSGISVAGEFDLEAQEKLMAQLEHALENYHEHLDEDHENEHSDSAGSLDRPDGLTHPFEVEVDHDHGDEDAQTDKQNWNSKISGPKFDLHHTVRPWRDPYRIHLLKTNLYFWFGVVLLLLLISLFSNPAKK